jgi:hypothetical protein
MRTPRAREPTCGLKSSFGRSTRLVVRLISARSTLTYRRRFPPFAIRSPNALYSPTVRVQMQILGDFFDRPSEGKELGTELVCPAPQHGIFDLCLPKVGVLAIAENHA